MEVCLILSADKWSMPDENTGEIREGTSVWFLNNYRDDSESSAGDKPTKVSAPTDLFNELKGKLPGYFQMHYGSRPGSQSKAQLTLIGCTFVKQAELAFKPVVNK